MQRPTRCVARHGARTFRQRCQGRSGKCHEGMCVTKIATTRFPECGHKGRFSLKMDLSSDPLTQEASITLSQVKEMLCRNMNQAIDFDAHDLVVLKIKHCHSIRGPALADQRLSSQDQWAWHDLTNAADGVVTLDPEKDLPCVGGDVPMRHARHLETHHEASEPPALHHLREAPQDHQLSTRARTSARARTPQLCNPLFQFSRFRFLTIMWSLSSHEADTFTVTCLPGR